MRTWEEPLAGILEGELRLLEQLGDLAQRKSAALKAGNVPEIDRIVRLEQPLALEMQAAESRRLALLRRYHLEDRPLREIGKLAAAGGYEKLARLSGPLAEASGRVRRANTLNAELTHIRLEYSGRFLRAAGVGRTYDSRGAADTPSKSTVLMDQKI